MNYENWENDYKDNRKRQRRDSEVIVTWCIVIGISVVLMCLTFDVLVDIISKYKK